MRRGAELTARALTGLAVVLGVAALFMAPAQADLVGMGSSASQTATSGTWAAVATTQSAAPYSTSPLALTFTKNGTSAPAPKYFWVVNVGTLSLTEGTYSVSASPTVDTVAEACSGTWNEATGLCAGTISTVVASTSSPAVDSTVPSDAGSRIRLRARITTKITTTTRVTIGVDVAQVQARSGVTSTN